MIYIPRSEPDATESPAASCLGGCVSWLLLIIGGICYWNYWKDGIEKKAREEVERQVESSRKAQSRIAEEQMRTFSEERKREAEQWEALLEEWRRSRARP